MSLDVGDVDAWIDTLSQCKQLSESDVKLLCDKVSSLTANSWSSSDDLCRHERYS